MVRRNRARERSREAHTPLAPIARPPATVTVIDTEPKAETLAHWLLQPSRTWPVVVVSTASGTSRPYIDADQMKSDIGDLAEVTVLPAGDLSWVFSSLMPPLTQVYGGASRVYSTDLGWVRDPRRSVLRFAYSPYDDSRVRARLVEDAIAAAGGTHPVSEDQLPGAGLVSGTVRGLVGSRGLITLADGRDAVVWQEFAAPGIPLERVLAPGMHVAGHYDPVSRRLDLRAAVNESRVTQLGAVGDPGEIVLAEVMDVHDSTVALRPTPDLVLDVHRDAVTGNSLDKLTDLFSQGEVVLARIDAAGTGLVLNDIGDTEEPTRLAPSLLPGGPPWLEMTASGRALVTPPVIDQTAPRAGPIRVPARPARITAPAQPPVPIVSEEPLSDSTLNPRRKALREVSLLLAAERSRATVLDREVTVLRTKEHVTALELAELRHQVAALSAELADAHARLEDQTTRYRRADRARQLAVKENKTLRLLDGREPASDAFLDPVEQFRHEVYLEWTRRVPAAEKAHKPLGHYLLGPEFLASLDTVEGVARTKVSQVVVDILTGDAKHLTGRDVHRLRSGPGGDDYYVERDDGAQAWRVALQRGTPGARRLHYWRLPGGGHELSRVVLHDDMEP